MSFQMDFETGEDISCDEGSPDQETGETPASPQKNGETGEYEYFYRTYNVIQKVKGFKIPSHLIKRDLKKEVNNTNHEEVEARLVFTGVKPHSKIFLFIMPTLTLIIPGFIVVLLVLEMILHKWAHKRNEDLLKDNINNIYYQSPYHVVAREFCPRCRTESLTDKIAKLQDQRTRRLFINYGWDYVKQVV
ncbi:uncharacterized protein [Onthophagus taurus]|uniref:uncharacterized protein n=1 Tax=Onthophagus taurus TaxID=166361 RepID=UPI000C205ACC|nr:uncharacterized protein LOC111416834 [Onthophagus taurus]